MEYTIIEKKAFSIVGIKYYGNNSNNEIHGLWEAFEKRINEIENRINVTTAYGYDTWTEEIATTGNFIYYAAAEVTDDTKVPSGMDLIKVPSNKYAVFQVPYDSPRIDKVIQSIYKDILPAEGLELNGDYDFEIHHQKKEKSVFYFHVPIK